MLKIAGLLMLLLLLAACKCCEPNEPAYPVAPLAVHRIRPGMTREQVFHCLNGYARLTHVWHHRDARIEDWQEVELPEGHLDLWFTLKYGGKPGPDYTGPLVPVDSLARYEDDRLIRLQFTNHVGWVERWGDWPEEGSAEWYRVHDKDVVKVQ
jgi:hypothetical protein